MPNEYNRAVLEIQRERYAICAINGIFAMLGIISWLGPSHLALASLAMILVVNATFLLANRRGLKTGMPSASGVKSAAYERYMISTVNAIFAMLGIVSWWDLTWLALVALILILAVNCTFPFQHQRRLREARRKQIDGRLRTVFDENYLTAP